MSRSDRAVACSMCYGTGVTPQNGVCGCGAISKSFYSAALAQEQMHAAEADKASKRSALDTQEGGDHYRKMGAYQPWEVLAKWMTPDELRGFAKGTVIAYLAREQDKGGRLDIKKAMHTLQIYLELSEGQQ